jgi:hypothetical protein
MTDKPPSLPGGASIGWEQSIGHKGTSACADDTNTDGGAVSKPMTDDRARELARMVLLNRWSFSQRGPDHGYGGPGSKCGDFKNRDVSLGCDATAVRLLSLPAFGPDGTHPVPSLTRS